MSDSVENPKIEKKSYLKPLPSKAMFLISLTLLFCLGVIAGFFEPVEDVWLDFLTERRASLPLSSSTKSSNIVVIDCPFYKEDYSNIVNTISKGEPALIVFTFLPQELKTNAETEKKIIFPLMISRQKDKNEIFRRPILKEKNIGFVDLMLPEPVRFISLKQDSSPCGSLLFEILKYYGEDRFKIEGDTVFFDGKKSGKLTKDKQLKINYFAPSIIYSKKSLFAYYSADDMAHESFDSKLLKDKIVVIAGINPINGNITNTPVGLMSYSEIISQSLYSILENKPLQKINPLYYCLIFMVAGILSKYIYTLLKGKQLLTATFIVVFVYLVFGMVMFLNFSIQFEIMPFLLSLLLIAVSNIYFTSEEKQNLIQQNVETFTPIVEKALSDKDSDDWGEAMLELICKPLDVQRGILLITAGVIDETQLVFHYPLETYRASEEELTELAELKEPALGKMTLAIPLIMKDETHYGAIKLQKMRYSSWELKQLAAISKIAMISINNKRLLGRIKNQSRLEIEAELAGQIQQTLLAETPPEIKGADIACKCIPASEVGGDYFDFFLNPKGYIGIACGDVTGHGMAAAIIMGLLRSVVRTQGRSINSAGEVVTQTNNILYNDFVRFSKMASLFYCTYSPIDKTIVYTTAGHTPPILIRSYEMEPKLLKGKGPILGFRPNIKYKEFRIKTYPKDVIIFMTDGIVEAENSNKEFYGTERLEQLVNEHIDDSAKEILDTVFEDVTEFTKGVSQKDDMTLIIMKV